MNICVAPSSQASWLNLVQEAAAKIPYTINDDIESYLIFLLIRFTKNSNLADTILALDYLESHSATGSIKPEQLRDVGDKCLLFSGFYPEQAHTRLVSLEYFVNIGRSAYSEIAKINHYSSTFAGLSKLFAELASNFVILLEILHQIKLLDQSKEWMLDEILKYEKRKLLNSHNNVVDITLSNISPNSYH